MSTATLEALPAAGTGSVIVIRERLAEALEIVAGVVKQRTPKPILRCVRIDVGEDGIRLSGTNLESWVKAQIAHAQVEHAFSTAVSCERLLAILKEMGTETVKVSMTPAGMEVRGESATFTLPTFNLADMPNMPEVQSKHTATIQGPAFARLLRQARCATESGNLTYPGAFIGIRQGQITMAATEGHVMVETKSPCSPPSAEFTAQLPVGVFPLAERVVSDAETVKVGAAENMLAIEAGDVFMATVQPEAKFPDYVNFIPRELDKKATTSVEELSSAIRQAAMTTSTDGLEEAIRFKFTRSGLSLSSRAEGIGTSSVSLPLKYEGADIEIGFKARYVSPFLRVIETPEVSLEMLAPNRPGVMRAGDDLLLLVMPVNLT